VLIEGDIIQWRAAIAPDDRIAVAAAVRRDNSRYDSRLILVSPEEQLQADVVSDSNNDYFKRPVAVSFVRTPGESAPLLRTVYEYSDRVYQAKYLTVVDLFAGSNPGGPQILTGEPIELPFYNSRYPVILNTSETLQLLYTAGSISGANIHLLTIENRRARAFTALSHTRDLSRPVHWSATAGTGTSTGIPRGFLFFEDIGQDSRTLKLLSTDPEIDPASGESPVGDWIRVILTGLLLLPAAGIIGLLYFIVGVPLSYGTAFIGDRLGKYQLPGLAAAASIHLAVQYNISRILIEGESNFIVAPPYIHSGLYLAAILALMAILSLAGTLRFKEAGTTTVQLYTRFTGLNYLLYCTGFFSYIAASLLITQL
jgi:hypothetical protein